jgi:hypothetical protein
MAKFLKLTVDADEGDRGFNQGHDIGEDDVPSDPTQSASPPPATHTVTILDPLTRIRSFSPRKYGRQGTRIVFMSGAGLPVLEDCSVVEQMLRDLYPEAVTATAH